MELSTAIKLIGGGILKSGAPQQWADLGAGNGLFTQALASVLPANSSALAVDQNAGSLKSITWNFKSVSLRTHKGDFTLMNWGESFDGILMANSLHFVQGQSTFLRQLRDRLTPSGRIIVVEYENRQANSWVPYPIGFARLKEAGERSGYCSISKLEETASIYGEAIIYSAVMIS